MKNYENSRFLEIKQTKNRFIFCNQLNLKQYRGYGRILVRRTSVMTEFEQNQTDNNQSMEDAMNSVQEVNVGDVAKRQSVSNRRQTKWL